MVPHYAALVLAVIFLAACGFTPLYQATDSAIGLRAIEFNKGQAAEFMAEALDGRLTIQTSARFRLEISATSETRKLQLDSSGRAARTETIVTLRARLTDDMRGETDSFSLSEHIGQAQLDSGADQLRDAEINLELASAQLAERLLLQLARRINQSEAAQ